MVKRTPLPLPAVRAFDAAARHLSFSLAAEELNVTQSAVSKQVRVLEDFLQQALFVRMTRKIALTSFGELFYVDIAAGLDLLEKAATRMRPEARLTLRISLPQSLASIWLMPRLSSFSEMYPNIDVRVSASMDPANLAHEDLDVAIRLGRLPGKRYLPNQPVVPHELVQDWTGVNATYLWDEVLTPVVSAKLLGQSAPLKTPADLRHYKLLHVALRPTAWRDWFRTKDVPYPAKPSMEFGHFFMALEAARRGSGVALIPKLFLDSLESRGDMVFPFESTVKSAGEYYFLCREKRKNDSTIRLFRKWLLTQGQKHHSPQNP
jgi:LysR family glycine cleavage system transcriptional activator